jgi:hypothetical protein
MVLFMGVCVCNVFCIASSMLNSALFLEAPVSGSKGPAEQGALIFLTAGKRWCCSWGGCMCEIQLCIATSM